jgi:hypothetical protein
MMNSGTAEIPFMVLFSSTVAMAQMDLPVDLLSGIPQQARRRLARRQAARRGKTKWQ